MVNEVGSLPASVNAMRIENNGIARITSTSSAAVPAVHGCRCTTRLQRYQKPRTVVGRPVCSRPGRCQRSMARPQNPSSAGSRVSAEAITSTTPAMADTARPCMNGRFIRNRPHSEMITVHPANSTERPEVACDTVAASRGSRPSTSPWRYRVTMNSA